MDTNKIHHVGNHVRSKADVRARTGGTPQSLESFTQRTGAPTAPGQTRPSLDDVTVPEQHLHLGAIRYGLSVVDGLVVTGIMMLVLFNAYVGLGGHAILAPIVAGLLGTIGFFIGLKLTQAHEFGPRETWAAHMKKVAVGGFSAMGLWLATGLLLKPDTFLPDALAASGLIAMGALFVLHSAYHARIQRYHREGRLLPTVVMVGATHSARRLIEENTRNPELNIVAIFDDRLSRAPMHMHGVPVCGDMEDLKTWDKLPHIDRIVVMMPKAAESRAAHLVGKMSELPNKIALVVDQFEDTYSAENSLSHIAQIGMNFVSGKPKGAQHVFMKRLQDVVISGTALICLAPLLAFIALLIKLDSPGPVFFRQQRHGFNNQVFNVLKFRSLRHEAADKQAKKQVTAGDDRVTRIGRFIRKTSIDELPQLINVLRGDMSLVGPRPHAVGMHTGDVETHKLVHEYAHRHRMKPGLTGWAQINGSRGPLHDAESVERRVQLDVEYIERSNFWFDLMIMFKTVPCLLGDSENIR